MTTEPAPAPNTDTTPPVRRPPERVWGATDWVRRTMRLDPVEDALLKDYCRDRNQPLNDAVREAVMAQLAAAGYRPADPAAPAATP